MSKKDDQKAMSMKTLTKSSVWDVQENDIFRMWDNVDKDAVDIRESLRRYVDIVRNAFMIEEIKNDDKKVKEKFIKMGYKVAQVKIEENKRITWAIKKRPIVRVTDLTYENIRHISAAKLIEVLDRNFGGGWDSLSQSIKDIIESGFDISTTTLPSDRLHKKGGMYEKKMADGYEVLEVKKGTWVEAIFAKLKPETEKPRMKFSSSREDDEDRDDEEDYEIEDDYNKPDEEDEMELSGPQDDEITEENYSTMMEIATDPDEEVVDMTDYVDE